MTTLAIRRVISGRQCVIGVLRRARPLPFHWHRKVSDEITWQADVIVAVAEGAGHAFLH